MRFRKSIKLGGLKLNLSKSGIGVSTGIKGFNVGISPSKGSYYSYGIPGTGLYNVKYQGSRKNSKQTLIDTTSYSNENVNNLPPELMSNTGCLWSFFTVIFLILLFPLGVCSLIGELIWYFKFYKNTDKYKASVLFNEAKNEITNGNFAKARGKLNTITAMFPTISNLNKMIMECYLAEENYISALECIKGYCSTLSEKLQLIEIAYAAKEYQTVIDYVQSLSGEITKDVSLITLIGASYYQLGKYEMALEVLLKGPTRKRNMDDFIVQFRYFLGITYEALEQNKKAIQQYNKILAYDETYRDVKERMEHVQK